MSAFVSVRSLACSFLSFTPHDQRTHDRRERAARAVRVAAASAASCRAARRLVVGAHAVVRITRRVNATDALAAAHERDERRLARFDHLLGVRLPSRLAVEEAAGRAREEQGVVLLEVLRVDVRGIVGDRRRCPRARLLAEFLDRPGRERNRGMDVAARIAEHQDLPSPRRLGWRRRGQRGHHLRHIVRARRLADGRQVTAAAARRERAGAAAGAPAARPPPAPPPAGAAAGAGRPRAVFSAGPSTSIVTEPPLAASAASYHLPNAVRISARVTDPFLSASKAVHNAPLVAESRCRRLRLAESRREQDGSRDRADDRR